MPDQPITKSEAHVLFGKLYRAPRSPDDQKKINQIVATTSDIFLRIKRIKELDRKNKPAIASQKLSQSGSSSYLGKRAFGNSTNKNVGKGDSRRLEMNSGLHTLNKVNLPYQESDTASEAKNPFSILKKSSEPKSPGFLGRLFGEKNSDLIEWGKKTKTLNKKFLKLNLSREAKKIFSTPSEDEVIKAIKGFRIATGGIWEKVDAKNYNSLIAIYQFYSEFIKFGNIFSRVEDPENWIQETLSMQKHYAQLLHYSDYKETLTTIFLDHLRANKVSSSFLKKVENAVNHIVSLEKNKPTLKNVIIAFYILAEKKLHRWSDIEQKLGVHNTVTDRFCAPKEVMTLIQNKIQKLQIKQKLYENEVEEIENIRKNYLSIDENGDFDSQFLNELIQETVHRTYGKKELPSHVMNSYKRRPHRLLFSILRDYSIHYIPLLRGSLTVSTPTDEGTTIQLFSHNVFASHVENFNQILRSMEEYYRKYTGFDYSFSDFVKNSRNYNILDPSIKSLHSIIQKTNDFFRSIVFDIQTVVKNHKNAKEHWGEKNGIVQKQEVMNRPIPSIEIKQCYIPYAEAVLLVNGGRLAQKTVYDALQNLMSYNYNYLYIFRDSVMCKLLASDKKLQEEAKKIEENLKRLNCENDDSIVPKIYDNNNKKWQ